MSDSHHPHAKYLEEVLLEMIEKRDKAREEGDVDKMVVFNRLIDVISDDLSFCDGVLEPDVYE